MTEPAVTVAGEHRKPRPSGWTAIILWALLPFVIFTALMAWNQFRLSAGLQRVDDNGHAIQVLFYDQCQDRNATTARQNGLIDRAIEAERHRTKPNAESIKSLTQFKGTISSCGPKP